MLVLEKVVKNEMEEEMSEDLRMVFCDFIYISKKCTPKKNYLKKLQIFT